MDETKEERRRRMNHESYLRTKVEKERRRLERRALAPTLFRLRANEAHSRWALNNVDKRRTKYRRYVTRKSDQLHPTHNESIELNLQRAALEMSKISGMVYHIDHIIPLSHGGWHHHDNLQILPDNINVVKNANPFWELSGFKSWRDVPVELWPETNQALMTVYLVMRDSPNQSHAQLQKDYFAQRA